MRYRIGMGQMLVEQGDVDANLARARAMIGEAARRDCAVVVLPECLDLGWTWPGAATYAEPIPGPRSGILTRAAREAGIHVVAGLTERDGGFVYNTAVLFTPQGNLLLKHRKINELEVGRCVYATGDRLGVVRTPLGTVGLLVCADNFPDSPALAEALARMGAQILLSPCAWAVDGDHDNGREPYGELWMNSYSALAKRFDLTVVGVSNVGRLKQGPWAGRKCIGCSLAMGPGGEVLARGPYGADAAGLLTVEVEPRGPIGAGTDFSEALAERRIL